MKWFFSILFQRQAVIAANQHAVNQNLLSIMATIQDIQNKQDEVLSAINDLPSIPVPVEQLAKQEELDAIAAKEQQILDAVKSKSIAV